MIEKLKDLATRVKLLLTPVIIDAINNDGEVQTMKVSGLEGEVIDNVQRIEDYGRTTVPPTETGALLTSVAGNRTSSSIIKAGISKDRPKEGENGDIIDWDIHGNKVKYTKEGVNIVAVGGGEINIAKTGKISITASDNNIVLNDGILAVARATDPVSTAPTPAELVVLATALLQTGLFLPTVPTPVPPVLPTIPVTFAAGQIVSGNATIKG